VSTAKRVEARPLLDGQRIRWTLERVEQETQQKVRIDWLRFTLPLDAVVRAERAPCPVIAELASMDRYGREVALAARIADASIDYTGALALARSCANRIVEQLGLFEVGPAEDRGMDYYAARCPLIYEGLVVGYCLAGSKSPNQAGTVHVNLFGAACLYVAPAKWARLKRWIAECSGWLTRVDLACDVWTGDLIEDVPRRYGAGAFDVRGQRPKESQAGSWYSGHSRTFYVGKRETGKMFRAYEKGDELFGEDANDPWVRYEVELRNNARVLDLEVLERPADFFAGAYPFTEALLARLSVQAVPQSIPAGQRVQDANAEAAVTRLVKAGARMMVPTFNALLVYGGSLLDHLLSVESHRVPARLRGYAANQLQAAFSKVAAGFAPPASPSMVGA